MALDVYLQKDASLPETGEIRFLSFEDDGYFWFLYLFFEELTKHTDQVIYLSEDAFFKGKDLDLFSRIVKQVGEEIKQKPDVWEEFIGTIIYKRERKKPEKIYSTVVKKELESILKRLERTVNKAKKQNIGIFFFGD